MVNENKKPVLTTEQIAALDNQVERAKADARKSEGLARLQDNTDKRKAYEEANPGKGAIIFDKPNRPWDWLSRYADMLVNPVNGELRVENINATAPDFLNRMGANYGKRYCVSIKWFEDSKRKAGGSPEGKAPNTIAKAVKLISDRGVTVPVIDAPTISFSQLRKHLLGKGKAQENVMQGGTVTLGQKEVMWSGKRWTWMNALGVACEVDTAVGLTNDSKLGRSTILIGTFLATLGLERNEMERRCNISPTATRES